MSSELINADFTRRVVIATAREPWIPSPQAGVERRLLDRIGGELARATSVVRYAPASAFPAHEHALGEEFLVLDGVFADEFGDYPTGTYIRNPPGSRHSPRTDPGCTILVKLRQMSLSERKRTVVDTAKATWRSVSVDGLECLELYRVPGGEHVTMERLGAGVKLAEAACPGGEEIFVLSGVLTDEHGTYGPGTWIRNPAGFRHSLESGAGTTYWAKRGHLPA
jgi:anti-sigma factor ChrR (cupin superfamily)